MCNYVGNIYKEMLLVLTIHGLQDVCTSVVRWSGGIHASAHSLLCGLCGTV